MEEIKQIVKWLERPELKEPIMVSGVPDSGLVAKIVMDYLISPLKAKPFVEIYSYGFSPQVLVKKDGTLDLVKGVLYYVKRDGNDLILFTADEQPRLPEAAYSICNDVLDLIKELGVKIVYTVGASITGTFVDEPKVYGVATHPKLLPDLKKHGIIIMNSGTITWMNGLMFALTKIKDMEGIFISAETSGYIADAKAARAIVAKLNEILNLNLSLEGFNEMIEEMERTVRSLKGMEPYKKLEEGKKEFYR
ncbi:hypothetical protein HRbin06_00981 [archaeon HR06]|nr:hypothetical protein HRbin06_00981 [archaeon HR06]